MGALRPSAVLSFRQSSASFLKLFALPLTRPLAQNGAAPPPAFLLHAKRTPAADVELKNDDGTKKDLPYVTRATVWAADNWQKLGQANEGTWKRKAYVSCHRIPPRQQRAPLDRACLRYLSAHFRHISDS